MQREPGKRDYGTSDCAQLRSLASRGTPPPLPAKPAPRDVPQPRHPSRPVTRRVPA